MKISKEHTLEELKREINDDSTTIYYAGGGVTGPAPIRRVGYIRTIHLSGTRSIRLRALVELLKYRVRRLSV